MNLTQINLVYYIPSLVPFCDGELHWDYYDNLYNELREKRRTQGKEGELVEANIYDIILEAKKGDKHSLRLLNYINQVFYQLDKLLDTTKKQLLKNTLHKMLSSHDHKYLNFVGELAVLHQLLDSKVFTLNKVEAGLPNGKFADFELLNRNMKPTLLEVQNIHLSHEKVIDNDQSLYDFFEKRRMDKIISKKLNLPNDTDVQFVDILWGSARSLYIYSKFFRKHAHHLSVVEPMAYVTFDDPSQPHKYEHLFGRISKLFNGNIDMSFMKEN